MKAKTITAIICITALLALALYRDIDGVLLAAGIAGITGLAGYEVGKHLKR